MIIPIMTHGSEIWISDFKLKFETLDKSPFEKTQNIILKNLLGSSWQVLKYGYKM